jgi:hypothetical protein
VATVFFSYSHKDEALRDELEVHLAMLIRQGLISTWHDRRISAGEVLDSAVDENLEAADIILCLASPEFIASEYCYSREMQRALERHENGEARVIPVILRHCEWDQTPLKGLRGTPRDNKPIMAWPDRDEAFNYVARDIRNALAEMGHNSNTSTPEVAERTPKPETASSRPRSSNLRVKREFTDLERDTFLATAFEFVAEFLLNSIEELKSRHPTIDGRLQQLDAKRFTVALYKNGKKQSAMTVFLGGMFGTGRQISFNYSDTGDSNSSNGHFSLQEGQDDLRFNADLFDFGYRSHPEGLESIHVAEVLWERLMKPLQD